MFIVIIIAMSPFFTAVPCPNGFFTQLTDFHWPTIQWSFTSQVFCWVPPQKRQNNKRQNNQKRSRWSILQNVDSPQKKFFPKASFWAKFSNKQTNKKTPNVSPIFFFATKKMAADAGWLQPFVHSRSVQSFGCGEVFVMRWCWQGLNCYAMGLRESGVIKWNLNIGGIKLDAKNLWQFWGISI